MRKAAEVYCKTVASILRAAQAVVKTTQARCTHCVNGKVANWVDSTDEQKTYDVIDLLDPETKGRLVKREIDRPLCGGSSEVPKYVRETRVVRCDGRGFLTLDHDGTTVTEEERRPITPSVAVALSVLSRAVSHPGSLPRQLSECAASDVAISAVPILFNTGTVYDEEQHEFAYGRRPFDPQSL